MNTAIKVIKILENEGFEAYMVGGAVRDYLLGKKPHDVDVATSASPEQVKNLFRRTVDTGIAHGTVLVLWDGEGIEVTTFRTEGSYSDSRRPDSVAFVQSLEEDLKRRDFTINAMAMKKDLQVIDLYGGREDLEKGLIRAVGNPSERFREDALRMLRAVRFSGQLDFRIDPETLAAIRIQAERIRAVAVERLKMELDKIMSNAHTARSMGYLTDSGLIAHLPAGQLFDMDWSGYTSTGTPLKGWLYMLFQQQRDVSEIRAYKFSNDEKRKMERVLEAARTEYWDDWTIYAYSAEQLELAAELKKVDINAEQLKSALPIRSKSELAVTGRDLLEWSGERQGPWLKEWLGRLERKLVFGDLQNDKELIKDWFLDEYNRDA